MYEYIALSANRKLIRGTFKLRHKGDIVVELRNRQLYPLLIRDKKNKKSLTSFRFKLKSKDLIAFISSFCMLLKTGITDTESIRLLYQTTKKARIKNKCQNLYNNIVRGNFIYQGLKEEGFPELLVASIRAGEENGTLLNVLNSLVVHYEKEKELKDKLKQAMIYPVILLIITTGIIVLASVYIIPSFAEIFYDFEISLPPAMQTAINIGNFLKNYWVHLSIGLTALIASLYFAMKIQVSRFYIQLILLNLPIIKSILQKMMVSRFARILSILLTGDVFLVDALKLTAVTIQNKVYEKSIFKIAAIVERGNSFESAMQTEEFFPEYLVSLLEISGEAGDYKIMLEQGGEIYDREATEAMHSLILILEPTVLIIIGLVALFLAFTVMMPMYDILDSVGL